MNVHPSQASSPVVSGSKLGREHSGFESHLLGDYCASEAQRAKAESHGGLSMTTA